MPLWKGIAPHIDPYKDLCFWVELAGSQADLLWKFKRQTFIKSWKLTNVPCFVLDHREPGGARWAYAIEAKMTFKCEKTERGLLKCDRTEEYFNKLVLLHPKPQVARKGG